jgi:hypothetical protein
MATCGFALHNAVFVSVLQGLDTKRRSAYPCDAG